MTRNNDVPLFTCLFLSGASGILCSIGFVFLPEVLTVIAYVFFVTTFGLGYFAHKDAK